jgi:16S rRNA (guanine527-N7)-methyltransferase
VIDVGSGGGLPGIPLAITMPDVTFALVEATGKKAAFLADVVEELALDNVTIIAERAETVGQPDGGFRNAADAVIARAVGPLCVLLELTLPLARVDGLVLAIKGRRAAEELTEAEAAMRVLKGERISCERSETGTVVAIRKIGETPRRFPRRPGEPKRNPIGGTSS